MMEDALYSVGFQKEVLNLLANNIKFALNYGGLLKREFFDAKPTKILFDLITKFVYTYETEISLSNLLLSIDDFVEQRGFTSELFKLLKNEANSIFNTHVPSEQPVIDRLLTFIRQQAMKQALFQSIEILEKGGDYEQALRLIDSAVSVGSGTDDGDTYDDFEGLALRYRKTYHKDNLIRTGITSFDNTLMGGMAPGEVHVIIAPPKIGKSTMACNCGLQAMIVGKNIYHASLELKKLDAMAKYAIRMTGLTYHELMTCPIEEYKEKIKRFDKYKPQLFVNFWPEGTINALTLRSWITRKRSQTGKSPDLIIVDHDDCLLPTVKGNQEDLYNTSGNIYTDLIQLADYFNCFVGNTKISLLTGEEKTLKELDKGENFYVYSSDKEGEISMEEATSLGVTGYVNQLIEVELDNGHKEKCTLDHLWMLRDGTYKEAQDLKSGDSLMPLYRTIDQHGYEQYIDNKSGKRVYTHQKVGYDLVPGISECWKRIKDNNQSDRFLVVHHKINPETGPNKRNNDPSALEWMGENEHMRFHSKFLSSLLKKWWSDPSYREKKLKLSRQHMLDQWEDSEFQQKMSETGSETMTKLNADPVFKKNLIERLKKEHKTGKKVAFEGYLGSERHKQVGSKTMRALNKKQWADPKYRKKRSDQAKRQWEDPTYRKVVSEKARTSLIERWKDEKYVKKISDAHIESWKGDGKNKYIKPKIVNLAKCVLASGLQLTEENYEKLRNRAPSWEMLIKYFGTVENLLKEINHKVKCVKLIQLSQPEPVYCINVPTKSNFALSSGVFVHNCAILTFCQPVREAWGKPDRGQLIVSSDMAHSARKAHKAFSISSLNFKEGSNQGILYLERSRRGRGGLRIPIERNLDRAVFREIPKSNFVEKPESVKRRK